MDKILSGEIHVDRLKAGTVILVETEDAIYELEVLNPETAMVEVNTNDTRLKEIQAALINGPIRWGSCMPLVLTTNSTLYSRKCVGATIRGDGWSYDVF